MISTPPRDSSAAAPLVNASTGRPAAVSELEEAIQDYKRRSGRLFPTWSEVLEVARELGYTKSSATA